MSKNQQTPNSAQTETTATANQSTLLPWLNISHVAKNIKIESQPVGSEHETRTVVKIVQQLLNRNQKTTSYGTIILDDAKQEVCEINFARDFYITLEPKNPRPKNEQVPPHLFICDINPRQAIPEAIEQAAYLLAAGDYVVITDITPRNIDNLIAKVRKSHKVPYLLYHATDNFDIDFALHKSLKTYQGIITYPEMLMAQTQAEFANLALDGQSVLLDDYLKHLSTTDTFHSLHDLVKEGELKIATTGWLPLKPLAKNNNHEHPPLPPEFKIIEHWAKARNLEIGFVFNQFLGVLAGVVCTHLNATFAFNADSASPINLFVLASLEAGRGKSQLVKTLLKPLDTYHVH